MSDKENGGRPPIEEVYENATSEDRKGGLSACARAVSGLNSPEFAKGDEVRHRGEGVEGEVADTDYPAPRFLVEWEDGYETLETFHSVELIGNE